MDSLLISIIYYIYKNPGKDAVDVSNEFKIPLEVSVELTEKLLEKGLLNFDEN